jgi:xylulokinase
VAYEYAYYLGILRELIPDLKLYEARVIGGGAHSPVWNQIKADVLGVPYQPLMGSEFGSWGSAMIAGKSAGIFDDLATVADRHAHPAGAPIYPNTENHVTYEPLIARYIQWQAVLRDAYIKLG